MKAMKWLKRVSIGALALGSMVLATGATIEYRARASARAMPVPGKLVDVGGGRRIQLDCRGAGSPTVVLEPGLDVVEVRSECRGPWRVALHPV